MFSSYSNPLKVNHQNKRRPADFIARRAAKIYRFRAVSPRTIAKSGTTTLLRKRRVSARLTPPAPVRKNGFLLDSKEPDWSKLPPQGRQPQHGDRRKEMLEDIAILTGGTVISEEKGYKKIRWHKQARGRLGCRHRRLSQSDQESEIEAELYFAGQAAERRDRR